LNKETVAKIRELMGLDSKPEILEGIAIHYRLGDLLSLGNKSFISSQTIVGAIHSQIPSIKNGEVNLFSDSIPAATEMLSELSDKFTIVPHDRNTVQSIKSLSAYEVFIGTNSKISLWVVLFRLNEKDTDKYTSLLPLSSRAEISRMIQNYGNLDSLNFY
jgi:hypothetical protein